MEIKHILKESIHFEANDILRIIALGGMGPPHSALASARGETSPIIITI